GSGAGIRAAVCGSGGVWKVGRAGTACGAAVSVDLACGGGASCAGTGGSAFSGKGNSEAILLGGCGIAGSGFAGRKASTSTAAARALAPLDTTKAGTDGRRSMERTARA